MSIFNDDVVCPGFFVFDICWLKVLFLAVIIFQKMLFYVSQEFQEKSSENSYVGY